jgi:hypothetical protein
MVRKFLLVIPNIAAAIAILVIGYIIARILKAVVTPDVNSGHERLSHAATCLA